MNPLGANVSKWNPEDSKACYCSKCYKLIFEGDDKVLVVMPSGFWYHYTSGLDDGMCGPIVNVDSLERKKANSGSCSRITKTESMTPPVGGRLMGLIDGIDEYVNCAVRTENKDYASIIKRLEEIRNVRLLHSAIGLCTEAGEFLDQVKKHLMYGKRLDEANLEEEIGDVMWYIALGLDALGLSFENVMRKNIEKLKRRYDKSAGLFSDDAAINRDEKAERKVLDDGCDLSDSIDA
jgi:NTP pyrophosphatase (non-canonical NTP hydrolase)